MQMKNNINEKVLEAYDKAKNTQATLNAVVTFIDPSEQLKELQGKENQPLYGVPIVLKDNVCTKGIKTTASSKILENYVPIYNAHIVDKLSQAGAITIAKSAMDELGMGGTNLTAATGPVKNPYDVSRMSGGSSGGSAALVAANVVGLAIGTDTGDSVRKPASFCGVVGLKPSYGRISRYGIIPYASSLDHVGLFTRSVKEAATALEVLAGRDDRDMTSSFKAVEKYSEACTGDIKGKKIAVFKNVLNATDKKETIVLFNKVVQDLEAKGAILKEVTLNEDLMRALLPTYYLISNCEATANHANLDGLRFGSQQEGTTSEEIMMHTRTYGFGKQVKKRFVIGSYGLFIENQDKLFRQAQKVRRLIVEHLKEVLEDVDALIAPASCDVAPKIEDTTLDQLDDAYLVAENHMLLGNFSGFPSITVPMGYIDGLPIGVNLTSKAFDESNLLNISYAIEEGTNLKNSYKEVKA